MSDDGAATISDNAATVNDNAAATISNAARRVPRRAEVGALLDSEWSAVGEGATRLIFLSPSVPGSHRPHRAAAAEAKPSSRLWARTLQLETIGKGASWTCRMMKAALECHTEVALALDASAQLDLQNDAWRLV